MTEDKDIYMQIGSLQTSVNNLESKIEVISADNRVIRDDLQEMKLTWNKIGGIFIAVGAVCTFIGAKIEYILGLFTVKL